MLDAVAIQLGEAQVAVVTATDKLGVAKSPFTVAVAVEAHPVDVTVMVTV